MEAGWLIRNNTRERIKRDNTDIDIKRKLLNKKCDELKHKNINISKISVGIYTGLNNMKPGDLILFGKFTGSGESLQLAEYACVEFDPDSDLWSLAKDGKRWLIQTKNIKQWCRS